MISIIVLHHDKAEYSRACLESLLCSSARPLEVVNIDNGSCDDTPQVLMQWEQQAREAGIETQSHRFQSNAGAILGRNRALEMARGDYLVFLDNDTLVAQTDWLEKLQDFLDADTRRAAVAPRLLFPWQPFLVECCGCGVSRRGRIQYLGRGQNRDAALPETTVQCAISAAWMMTRAWVERAGVLDDAFSPVQYEDLDWCYRARSLGGEVWAMPSVELFHFEHTTTSKSGDINFKYVTTKNGILFKKRWSDTFSREDGPDEATATWLELPRLGIESVDWRALLPRT